MTHYAIFGATSAIAEHAARALTVHEATFALVGRDREKLDRIAADLLIRGAVKASVITCDFMDLEAIPELVLRTASEIGHIDKSLIAFGQLPNQLYDEEHPFNIAHDISLSFSAPAVLMQSIANHMKPLGKGLIAVITSVAGDRGRQSNYVYGAAKGGLGLFAQGLRHRLAPSHIEVLDIRPGFVETPMTKSFKKGMLWAKPDNVGKTIAQAIIDNKGGRLYVPFFWAFIMQIIKLVPAVVFHKTKL